MFAGLRIVSQPRTEAHVFALSEMRSLRPAGFRGTEGAFSTLQIVNPENPFPFLRKLWRQMWMGGVAAALLAAAPVQAGENLFGTVTGVDPLPYQRFQLKQLVTLRQERNTGDYHALEFRSGVEYGLARNLESALYVNTSYVRSSGVRNGDGSLQVDRDDWRFDTVSLEFKYMLLSPYKDGIGLALDFRPAAGPEIQQLPVRFLAQKTFLDDTLVWGVEVGVLPEWNDLRGDNVALQWSTGVSYRFIRNWSAAVEVFQRHGFDGLSFDGNHSSALYVGPTLHYAVEKWWVTLGFLAQVSGEPETRGGRNLESQERFQTRLALGFNF